MERVHGGNVYEMARRFNLTQAQIVDFSASVSPLGIPPRVMAAVQEAMLMLDHYPDPDCTRFRQAIAEKHGVDYKSVLAGNGAAEIIYLLARMVGPGRALIPYPSFIEYECAVRSVGGQTTNIGYKSQGSCFLMEMDVLLESIPGNDLVFICNPNNPTATLWQTDDLLKIIQTGQSHHCLIVIDEAYLDLVDEGCHLSLVNKVNDHHNLIVLKSLTKAYALPGLRIGYAIGPPKLIEVLSGLRDPWSVNVLAQMAGTEALKDEEYLVRLQRLVQAERHFLKNELSQIPGLTVYTPTANFILADASTAGITTYQLQQSLAPQGFFIRDCANFRGLGPGFFRISIRTRADNQRLVNAISDYFLNRTGGGQ